MMTPESTPLAEPKVRKRRSRGLRSVTQRSIITNGTMTLPDVDHRSTWMRRLRDLQALHLADLGGEDAVSEAELSLVRRISTLTVSLEQMERNFALAGAATVQELDAYQRASNSLRRLLEAIGLQRRPKDVTPDLRTYLKRKAAT
jgi:hypothetical protein